MKLFTCAVCQQVLFFENVSCTRCGHALAYLPDCGVLSAMEAVAGAPESTALSPAAHGARYRLCRNYTEHAACNWAIVAGSDEPFCRACVCNDIIPDLSNAYAKEAWRRVERAKRRLFHTLLELGLPVEPKAKSPRGLGFHFMADRGKEHVFTGHSDGIITLNIAEADDPFREKMRLQMGEAYRTLLGHFRHEIGHYYWMRLIDDGDGDDDGRLNACRDLFGDERQDYAQAQKRHYDNGAPADWAERFVSAYASMHPCEDWAETWAHYLHIVDTLETARSYGLALQPEAVGGAELANVKARRLDPGRFDEVIAGWIPLTLALNSLNRGMGLPDLYPFVLSTAAIGKLRFVHDVIGHAAAAAG
jgi:hypothetical protein